MKKSKLAIILSHPVQYYSPLFVAAAKQLELKVFYGFKPNAQEQGKEGFGKAFEWDVDLLSGYDFEFVDNLAQNPSSAFYKGCDTPTIGERLKSFGATHVISFGWHLKMYRQALSYCNKNKIPIAVRGDSQLNPRLPLWKKLLKKIYYPYFLRKYDAFLSVGKRNKAYLNYYGVSDHKIIFSPHAIKQDFWKVEHKKTSERFVFIWVAKFIPKKRPLEAIKAFKKLLDEEPQLRDKTELRMVGSGELMKQAKAEAKEVKQIKFLGFKNQSELRQEYAQANCLLLTSDYGETWGLVVNEAFAAGVPAIVSDACGCSVDLIDGKSGKVYAIGEVWQIVAQMKQMVEWSTFDIAIAKKSIAKKNRLHEFSKIVASFNQFIESF